jgi:hypothetical protein
MKFMKNQYSFGPAFDRLRVKLLPCFIILIIYFLLYREFFERKNCNTITRIKNNIFNYSFIHIMNFRIEAVFQRLN